MIRRLICRLLLPVLLLLPTGFLPPLLQRSASLPQLLQSLRTLRFFQFLPLRLLRPFLLRQSPFPALLLFPRRLPPLRLLLRTGVELKERAEADGIH